MFIEIDFYWSFNMPILHSFTGLLTSLIYTVLLVYLHAYITQCYWSIAMPIFHSFTGLLTCLYYTVLLVY
jgi:succinate dehydrogenase/fumarate reductase cytochrome b subunit